MSLNGQVHGVIVVGNITRDVTLTKGGMAFLSVAHEAADADGKPLPVRFISVKCWGVQAQKSAEFLKKGQRVRLEVWVRDNTSIDNRSDDLKAKYPADPFEYLLATCEMIGQPKAAPVAAPTPVTAKPKRQRKSKAA